MGDEFFVGYNTRFKGFLTLQDVSESSHILEGNLRNGKIKIEVEIGIEKYYKKMFFESILIEEGMENVIKKEFVLNDSDNSINEIKISGDNLYINKTIYAEKTRNPIAFIEFIVNLGKAETLPEFMRANLKVSGFKYEKINL